MQYLIIFFIITIISIVISIKLRIKTEQAIPIAVIGLIVLVYLIGIAGNLLIGIYVILLLFILSTIYVIYYFIKNEEKRKEIFKQQITPGVLIYGCLYILFIILNKNRIFNDYDEFNHWALIIKDMYLNDNFAFKREAITAFNEYPPFTAVFEYIILKFSSSYSEDIIIIANNILAISLMMPIFKKVNWNKSIKWVSVILPIMLLIPLIIYSNFYFNILVDGLIGIFIAYILYQWFTNESNKLYRNISTGLGMIGISLIKSSGIGIAIVLTIIIIIDCIKTNSLNSLNKSNKKRDILTISIIFIICIALLGIWIINIEKNNQEKNWNMDNISIENIIEVIKGNVPNDRKGTINKYIERIIEDDTITERNLTVITATLLILAINVYVYMYIEKDNKKRYLCYSICLYVFELIYLGYMLLTYLFLFNSGEAWGFASFDRYYGTIFLGMLLFHVWVGIKYMEKIDTKKIIIILSIIIIFLPLNNIQEKIINANQDKINRIVERKSYTKIIDYKNILNENDKIYYIEETPINFQYSLQIMKYQMLPIKIDNEGVTADAKKLKDLWREYNYTYVYVQKVNDSVTQEFEEEFLEKIEDETMYKIIYEDKIIKLEKVEKYE